MCEDVQDLEHSNAELFIVTRPGGRVMTSFQRCEVLMTDPRTGRTRKSVALGPKWIVVHEWFTSTKSPLVSSKFTHDSRRHQRAFEFILLIIISGRGAKQTARLS